MYTTKPLEVLVVRDPADPVVSRYADAVERALQGGQEPGEYVERGPGVGVVPRLFSEAPPAPAAAVLDDGVAHALVVVLVGQTLLDVGRDALWDWLAECREHVRRSRQRHGMLIVPMEEGIVGAISAKRPALGTLQMRSVQTLGEMATRPAVLALRVLHECRLLLARAVPPGPGAPASEELKLFISHAKHDGLPLARSLKHQIEDVLKLEKFYDAEDIDEGSDWEEVIERAAGTSVVVMLRTDAYDSRPWCRTEVLVADRHAVPAVLIDARTRLDYVANDLPFDRVPTVRIPDGNLFRVLFLALREAVRFAWFRRAVEVMRAEGATPAGAELHVFPIAPSMAALLRACERLGDRSAGPPGLIIYPDPELGAGTLEAAEALISTRARGVSLTTPRGLAASGGAR